MGGEKGGKAAILEVIDQECSCSIWSSVSINSFIFFPIQLRLLDYIHTDNGAACHWGSLQFL